MNGAFASYLSLDEQDRRDVIEAGARSALDPQQTRGVTAYIDGELHHLSLDVDNIRVLSPQRTYWEKLLILHGAHCGYRDEKRLPTDANRISRHYYDAAKITATPTGPFASVSVDFSGYGCGVKTDHTIKCWGYRFPGDSTAPEPSHVDSS